ncbi:FecR protein [Maioricimonas rarisocia]|uniref:FecR protein n=1 Tax=Maioricimonas rarisocia TaxID=2528026 RepID=A0A517Z808_9PLAN|nr:LamG-like jellyroll fold domain-containing protein [Maioricimonas rarisocia]QDU38617.1 FecR protein [Maioricimonas rarisocia]
MNTDRSLEQLVQKYLDGTATPDDMERLNERLRNDEAARQWFIELLNVDSAVAATLVDDPDADQAVPAPVAPATSASPRPSLLPRRGIVTMAAPVLVASCLALLLALGLLLPNPQPFAQVVSAAGVSGMPNNEIGDGRWIAIDAGTIELKTARDAQIVIEAPARFRFLSGQKLQLDSGRLAASVPPSARGFTVVTPSGDAVDLGTRFGVDVPDDGQAEIHVFEGEVIAQPTRSRQHRSLTGGQALRMTDGPDTDRELRSAAFIHPDEIGSLHAALADGQVGRAAAALEHLRRDPTLIALLDFEDSALPQGTYRMVQGRWPGSRAPEFAHVGDHIKLNVGSNQEWPQLTLAAWVRLDRLGDPYQSLLHTDGWDRSSPGQVHWMVTRHTTMRLALYGNTLTPDAIEPDGYPDSRTSVLPEQGRWMHLATVYDAQRRTVRFYLNGQFDSETHQQIAHPARLGAAQIGNWNRQDRKLSGRIDELVLLGRALDDDEILQLYEAGNPYR